MLASLVAAAVAAFLLGVLGRLFYDRNKAKSTLSAAVEESKKLLELAAREAETKKKEIVLEARDKLFSERQEFDDYARRQKDEFERTQEHLSALDKELS